uniref:V.sativa protein binding to ENOD12B promoter n=1 Tax=Vicia sativa TaxID=3908 RepID=V9H1F0_VICSA|nr:hypothetical protein 1 - spring vetch [Vicia sativa]CAA65239.1 unnamed protein product [Vicia sativa]
MMMTLVSK